MKNLSMENYDFPLDEFRKKVFSESDLEQLGITEYKTIYCTELNGDYLGFVLLQLNSQLLWLPFNKVEEIKGIVFDSGYISYINKELYYELDGFIETYEKRIQLLSDIKNNTVRTRIKFSIEETIRIMKENNTSFESDLQDHNLNPCPLFFPYKNDKGFLFISCKDGYLFVPFTSSYVGSGYESFDPYHLLTEKKDVLDWIELMIHSYKDNLSFLNHISDKFKLYNLL